MTEHMVCLVGEVLQPGNDTFWDKPHSGFCPEIFKPIKSQKPKPKLDEAFESLAKYIQVKNKEF